MIGEASRNAAALEPLVAHRFRLMPWDLLELPFPTWARFVSSVLPELSRVTVAQPGPARTVHSKPDPQSEQEHRRRLTKLQGYR